MRAFALTCCALLPLALGACRSEGLLQTCDETCESQPDGPGNLDLSTDGPTTKTVLGTPTRHRQLATACTLPRAAGDTPDDLSHPWVKCQSDADCTAGLNGRCLGDPHDGWDCSYDACTSDADCPTGTLCDCRSVWHKGRQANAPTRCLPTNCLTDADCGAAQYCAPSFGSCGNYSGVVAWACTKGTDACHVDAECAGQVDGGWSWEAPYCMHDEDLDRWVCSTSQCAG